MAILVAKRLHATVIRRSVGSEGRFVSLTLSVNDFEFSVTSVYCPCPSADRVRFFDSVLEPLLVLPNHFILGDFNTVLDPGLDSLVSSQTRPASAARRLQSLLNSYSLADVYRAHHPSERGFTWRRAGRRVTQMCRLDLIVTIDCQLPSVCPRPDHQPMAMV